MNSFQKVIKYGAITLAVLLAITIISGIANATVSIFSIFAGDYFFVSKHKNASSIDKRESFADVESLDIDIASGNLIITTGDQFLVEADDVSEDFEMKVTNGGTLVIRERKRGFDFPGIYFNVNKNIVSDITLYIPMDYQLKEAKIDTGAGKVEIDHLSAEKLIIDAGAGNIIGSNLSASEVKLNGGAGKMTFENVTFRDMKLDSGVGNVEIQGVLLGENSIDCGVGNIDIVIDGREEDYDLDIETSLGSARLNGRRISKEYRTNNDASSFIEIDGGVGSIDIKFTR